MSIEGTNTACIYVTVFFMEKNVGSDEVFVKHVDMIRGLGLISIDLCQFTQLITVFQPE